MLPPVIETPDGQRYGTGAIQSPPDERDILLSEEATRLAAAVTLPASYLLSTRPPITNQGITPMCVAYSNAYDQAFHDRRDLGKFFDFNQHAFFYSIGGNAAGAVLRYALDRRLRYGYPEQDSTPSPEKHRLDSYALVPETVTAVKNGIHGFGGVLMVGPWYPNWTYGLNAKAVLPRPFGDPSGHAWWAVGWDGYGLIGQNSWGTAWGDNGLFRLPWAYLPYMWEVWTTIDNRTAPKVLKAVIRNTDIHIRNKRVVGDDGVIRPVSLWGRTVPRGIRREADGKIVATPYNKPLRYGGTVSGADHGIGTRSNRWAKVYLGGGWRFVARPLVRLVSA